MYWHPGYRLPNQWGIDFRFGPYLRQRFDDQTIEFSEIGAHLTYYFDKSLLSAIGLGPSATYTWGNFDFADEWNYGASVSAGFLLDKIRLTYGLRSFSGDDFGGDDFYWHLGINDVPGLAYWLTQGLE